MSSLPVQELFDFMTERNNSVFIAEIYFETGWR